MADYYPLIAKVATGLHNGHDRRRFYERGRNALVSELRAVTPPLSESVIAKERLAFEEAIRKTEEALRARVSELRCPATVAMPLAQR